MKAYRYSVLDAGGRRRSGIGYAATPGALRDQLIDAGFHPLALRPALFQSAARLSLNEAEAARFARDLAQLLRSGLSITQGLGLLIARETPRVGAFARDIRRRLGSGEPLSSALGAADGRPARFLSALARAGEASGRQADVMAAAGRSLAAGDALRRRLITLSLYPAFVIAVALISIAIYAYAVLPSLEPAFETMGDDLPLQTRTVLAFGAGVRVAAPVAALGALALALTGLLSPKARAIARDLAAQLLLAGKRAPLRDFIFAGFASRLAVMTQSGVPLSAAWRLARDPVAVTSVSRALAAQDARLMEGARLSDALGAVAATPVDLIHYVALGEQSGKVAEALEEGGRVLAERSQQTIERLLSVLTPIVIVGVGAMVGLITMMVFQGLLAVGDAVAL